MGYFSKIIGLLLLGFLVACTRSPKVVSLLEAEERAKADILKIEQIKKDKRLIHLALIKQSRLSVMPIDKKSWKIICEIGGLSI